MRKIHLRDKQKKYSSEYSGCNYCMHIFVSIILDHSQFF